MSVRIRLRRVGRKKQPYWRVVVVPRGAPRDGAYIEELGFYNPRTRPAFLTLDLEKLDEWIQNGAEITDSVKSLARKARKGGDDDVVFTKPGEEAPRLKTAKKPERRPKSATAKAAPEDDDTAPEPEEGTAEVTAAVEAADAAVEEATEAQEGAETESGAEGSATEPAPEAEPEATAEAVEEEEEVSEAEAEAEEAEEEEAEAEEVSEAEDEVEEDETEAEDEEAEDEEEDK